MRLPLLLLLVAGLLAFSCGRDSLGAYLKNADGTFELANEAGDKLGDDLAALPTPGSDAFFTQADAAYTNAASTIQVYRNQWRDIQPPKSAAAFHQRVATFLDKLHDMAVAAAEASRTKSAEKLFLAIAPVAGLVDDQNDINQEWIALAKKAKFDTSAVERIAKENTPETSALRAYAVQMLPVFGALVDSFADLSKGASTSSDAAALERFREVASRGADATSRAKTAGSALQPPPSGATAHRAITAMLGSLDSLYAGLRAVPEGQFRPLAEAYRPTSSVLSSGAIADCEWRNLLVAAELSNHASRPCSPPSHDRLADIDYAVGAFLVYGGTTDALIAAGATFSSASGQDAGRAFAALRPAVARLGDSANALLAEAQALSPPPKRSAYHASMVAYLSDLSALSRDVTAAISAGSVDRYNALLPRINDMLSTRFNTLATEFIRLWRDSTATAF